MKRQSKSNNHVKASSENAAQRPKLSKKPVKSDKKTASRPLTDRIKNPPASTTSLSLQDRYQIILSATHPTKSELKKSLDELRQLIFFEGLPDDVQPLENLHSIRSRIWKRLLALYHISASDYIALVQRGQSEVYPKIRNDTFRTLATDKAFLERVNEGMLIRLLNAYAWKAELSSRNPSAALETFDFAYVQGMNVLAAPFLYTMSSEVEAFFAFSAFIQHNCPLYVQPCLEGVHCGLTLVDKCLSVADPELFDYLRRKNLTAELYAFPSVLTFSACTPPLNQVLKIWDFLMAFGVHMNILCVVAQVLLIRENVLTSQSPMKILRTFPPLDAAPILERAKSLVDGLSEELYELLARHPFDPSIVDELQVQVGTGSGFLGSYDFD